MKYSMVKQFWNQAIDNIFTFFYKIGDFGRVFLDFILSFIEIWLAFFSIFYNIIMYIYYLFLFILDNLTQSRFSLRKQRPTTAFARDRLSEERRIPFRRPSVRTATRSTSSRAKRVTSASSSATSSKRAFRSSPQGGKKNISKSILESVDEGLRSFGRLLAAPFKAIASAVIDFFSKPRRSERGSGGEQGDSRSLIDEYMEEYEKKRRS
jgi:hypothetical protein